MSSAQLSSKGRVGGRETICIISFSPISRDARVLRQIEALRRDYELVVVGYGPLPAALPDGGDIRWVSAASDRGNRILAALRLPLLLLARLNYRFFDLWYWSHPATQRARRQIMRAGGGFAAIHANDWMALPLAMSLGVSPSPRLVLDLHEYAPLEFENRRIWRIFYPNAIRSLLRRAAHRIDSTITVAPAIADRYHREFGFDPIVVLNASDPVDTRRPDDDEAVVRLVHHGVAQRVRRLELMIDAVARTSPRFTLDLMLVGDPGYVSELKDLALERAPGRVRFPPPVSPEEIGEKIAGYDVGLCLLPPVTYNIAESLPNKMFDYISAGLTLLVGPTPAMAAFVRSEGIGLVAPSFEPAAIARVLEDLDADDLSKFKDRACVARGYYTATREMAKVVALYARLLRAAS